jgi:hypothetical protein
LIRGLSHCADKSDAFALKCLDEALLLAAVSDRTAGDIQARRYGGVGDDSGVPDGRDQLIFTDAPCC